MFFAKPWADALIVLVVVLLFFGPKRLPALGKSLGQGMMEFKDSITGHSKDDDEERTEIGGAATAPGANPATATSAPPAEPASAPVQAPATPEPQSAGVASSEQRS
jgi:sec-independent protein translocase protein TatA